MMDDDALLIAALAPRGEMNSLSDDATALCACDIFSIAFVAQEPQVMAVLFLTSGHQENALTKPEVLCLSSA